MEIPAAKIYFPPEDIAQIQERIAEVLKSGRLTLGKYGQEFEQKFSQLCGTKYAAATNSGTSALEIILRAIGVEQGEVITSTNTFAANPFAIIHAGARPVFVDIDYDLNMSVESAKNAITPNTKAIVVTHIGGLVSPSIKALQEICNDRKIPLIEDAAHAHGSSLDGKMAGSFGEAAACFDKNTKIITEKSSKPICQIRVGEKVLTHTGTYEKVKAVHKRHYKGTWYKLACAGMSSSPKWAKHSLRATEEHPILIYRNGQKIWMPIKDVKKTDWVYTWTKKCEVCGKKIPFFWQLCEYHNPAQLASVRAKIAAAKETGKIIKYKTLHYYRDILPYADKLRNEGYRVIPIGVAIPDIIAIKDGKVVAYEIENRVLPRKKMLTKYGETQKKIYDGIVWVLLPPKLHSNKNKTKYVIDENLARLPIKSIQKIWRRKRQVYNLTIEKNNSYFAVDLAVHNCSFYPTKVITSAEGGMVVTDNEEIDRKARILRDQAKQSFSTNLCVDIGYNWRLSEPHAIIGLAQLARLQEFIQQRRRIAAFYDKNIPLPIEPLKIPPQCKSNYYKYCAYLPEGMDRTALKQEMKQRGVSLSGEVYEIPCSKQPPLKMYAPAEWAFPVADKLCARHICLPISAVQTLEEAKYVTEMLKEAITRLEKSSGQSR